ncbi:phosphoethanolamine transferase [uncultured Selenomonas sp.]|uniref:phosphoethanolamine transferase n=1 Tax=uncultured Selenomonas sp. TaxID=159275 RepID=UPI0025D12BA4|nr:phosphoethanolamine transferase [uncultured Selenomonas sp.]
MHLSTAQQDTLIRQLVYAAIYFLCLIAFYINIGQDMGAGYFLPILVPMVAVLMLMQHATALPLFTKTGLVHLFAGLGWATAFPLLYTWTYNSVWYQSLICFDAVIGTAIWVFLTGLTGVLAKAPGRKVWAALLAVLDFLFLAVPFIQYAYYCIVWHCLSPASLMALYLTNWRESIDFIESNVGVIPACIIIAGFIIFLALAARVNCAFLKKMAPTRTDTRFGTSMLLVLLGAAALLYYLPQSSFGELVTDVTTYVEQTQSYGNGHDERYESLDIDGTQTLPARTPGTVIVVIGESASRDYMHAFTPDFPYKDTPWLDSQLGNPDFNVFTNAYSSWSQTVPVLQRALTEQSQYNDKEFFESTSIIDVAKKSGYTTYWFSNQGRYGQYDSAITLVAKTADRAEWTDDSYNFSDKYDDTLLWYLTQVDPNTNNFIVLHIMGSHIYYNNRYPTEFNQWHGDSEVSSPESYANSIHYTDYILSQVFDYAQKNLNLRAMVYFSDHGENLEISHNPDVFSYDMVRIPMFIYLSPEYQQALPGRTRAIRYHRSRYFTNDMLYDTISGLLNAPSSRYMEAQDLTSPNYAYTRANLTTMLGQQTLTDDPKGGTEQGF